MKAAKRKRTIAHLSKQTRTALGKEGAKAAARKRRYRPPENSYDADYFGDTSKLPAVIRKERDIEDGENWDETMFNAY